MKIAIDLTSLADHFSGIERFALSVTKEMILDRSKQYVLIFKNSIHKEFQCVPKNVECIVANGANKLVFNQITLLHVLRGIKADVFLFPAFPAPFFFSKQHSVSAIHDLSCWDCPGSNKKYMMLYFKLMYWKASRNNKQIITVSNFSKERICSILKVREECITVVPNGLSENLTEYQYDKKTELIVKEKYELPDRYLLSLSTLEPRKNLRLLVEAYVHLVQEGKLSSELVLAGRKGWMIDSLLEGIPVDLVKRIHFTGFVDDEDLPYIYKGAELFVFPSLYEGFGVPPIEAMSMGTPVVSSNATSLPEVLGPYASYFESNNVLSLEQAILSVISSGADPDRIVLAKQHANKYRWPVGAAIILELLEKLNADTQ